MDALQKSLKSAKTTKKQPAKSKPQKSKKQNKKG